MILLVANILLKGIAKLTDFSLDIDARKMYVQATLYGEVETIEVLLDGFAIMSHGESYTLFVQQAQSNRPWLNNLLVRIVRRAWPIPAMPQFKAQIALAAELFKAEKTS